MRDLKRLSVCLLICLLLHDSLAKRTRKTKRTKNEDDETTPQPNVVTYSTFGFNDVGENYDGFVPSSPDYASYLSGFGNNQETSTRLYAPAFPSAADNSPFNMYGQQSDGQPFTSGDNQEQPSMMQQYQQSFNFMNPFENSENHFQGHNEVADKNSDDFNAQVYGAKIGNKNRMKQFSQFNSSQPVFGSEPFNPGESFVQDPMPTQESKASYGESPAYSNYNMYNYAPTFSSSMVEEPKPTPSSPKNMNYKKVLEFSKYKPSYPSESETNKFSTETPKTLGAYSSMTFNTNDNKFYNNYHEGAETEDRDKPKPIGTNYLDYTINHIDSPNSKPAFKNTKIYSDYKDQFKSQPTVNYSDYSGWRNNHNKGYDFGNNDSSSFRYDYYSKKPFKGNTNNINNNDEVVGASSNMVDLSNYKFPDIDTYSSFKKYPSSLKQQASENYPSVQSYRFPSDDNNGDDFFSQMKNYYTTTPSSASHWGAFMKNNDYSQSSSSYKTRHKRPSTYSDETTDEIVHIPKRPYKYHIKHQGSKNSDWSSQNRQKRPSKEPSTRFKSEEDLLGLRNHDTSHPSYIPSFKINANDVEDEFEKYASENSFKNLVEKWRQSYLKSKKEFKDTLSTSYRDHDAYGSESKPMHMPVPKPYPIEVPHPVIVPVPQPYPVRVPVPKPVAIPVYKELTVTIEKPVPYPVIKKVPYPVEKPVPVPVEKEVQVPVLKPYPVPVPHVRPVFHHTKHSSHEDLDSDPGSFEENNYFPRPDRYESGSKNMYRYSKKPRSYRNRHRKPSTSHYYDRNRRRWPSRRPAAPRREQPRAPRPRPTSATRQYAPGYKDYEADDDNEGYYDYCKRSGNC